MADMKRKFVQSRQKRIGVCRGSFAMGERTRLKLLAVAPVVLYFRALSGKIRTLQFTESPLNMQVQKLVKYQLTFFLQPKAGPHPRWNGALAQVRLLWQGELVDELKSLCDYGIRSGSTLEYVLEAERFEIIIVFPNGHGLVCFGRPTDTIHALKSHIQFRTGIVRSLQCLRKHPRGESLQNGRTFSSYSITSGTDLFLKLRVLFPYKVRPFSNSVGCIV